MCDGRNDRFSKQIGNKYIEHVLEMCVRTTHKNRSVHSFIQLYKTAIGFDLLAVFFPLLKNLFLQTYQIERIFLYEYCINEDISDFIWRNVCEINYDQFWLFSVALVNRS